MDKENSSTEQPGTRWFIDLGWYQQHRRSIHALVQGYLCGKCRKQLDAGGREISTADLLSGIKDCCSKEPDFITAQLPVLESAFRFFLASGNQSLELEELGEQLSKRLGGDTYRTSEEVLSRLLKSDRYYGLRPAPG